MFAGHFGDIPTHTHLLAVVNLQKDQPLIVDKWQEIADPGVQMHARDGHVFIQTFRAVGAHADVATDMLERLPLRDRSDRVRDGHATPKFSFAWEFFAEGTE